MALVLKLVSWPEDEGAGEKSIQESVLCAKQIPVWIKAAINRDHLRRTKRRLPKGLHISLNT